MPGWEVGRSLALASSSLLGNSQHLLRSRCSLRSQRPSRNREIRVDMQMVCVSVREDAHCVTRAHGSLSECMNNRFFMLMNLLECLFLRPAVQHDDTHDSNLCYPGLRVLFSGFSLNHVD